MSLEQVQQEQDLLEDFIQNIDKKLQDLEMKQKQLVEGSEEWNQLEGEIQEKRIK